MAEALTISIDPMSTRGRLEELLPGAGRLQELPRLHTRSAEADLKLQQALASFDRAASSETLRAAQRRLLALGSEVVASVLSLLDQPQPPERADVLLALLVKWRGPEELADVARSREASPTLRASLAEGLARYADLLARDEVARARVADALAELARDPDVGVRIAAVEAIGLASLQGDRSIEAVLRRAATEDRSESVRSEALALLEGAE